MTDKTRRCRNCGALNDISVNGEHCYKCKTPWSKQPDLITDGGHPTVEYCPLCGAEVSHDKNRFCTCSEDGDLAITVTHLGEVGQP